MHAGELGSPWSRDASSGRIRGGRCWAGLASARRSGDWIVEQAVHNWDVMNWAIRARPVPAVALGRNDLFRDLQVDRNVHDYYSGVVE